jgi:beta-galactosidase
MEQYRADEHGEAPWTGEGSYDFVHIHLKMGNQQNDHSIRSSSDHFNMMETHTFPKSLPDWSNLEVIHRNTLPPRASFHLYNNETDALARDATKYKSLSLSGTWKFSLAKSPFDAPADFFKKKYDARKWGEIEVPGMWQLQGYGKGPQYVFEFKIEANC